MVTVWVISLVFGLFIGALPFKLLGFLVAFGNLKPQQIISKSALPLWYAGHKLASILLIICEIVKPAITFITISVYFHNDSIALYAAFLTAIISYFWQPFRFKASKSPLALIGFCFVLVPISAGLLSIVYLLLLAFVRRANMACISVCLLAPCLTTVLASSQIPYLLGFILPLLMLISFKHEIINTYPFKENKLPIFMGFKY